MKILARIINKDSSGFKLSIIYSYKTSKGNIENITLYKDVYSCLDNINMTKYIDYQLHVLSAKYHLFA